MHPKVIFNQAWHHGHPAEIVSKARLFIFEIQLKIAEVCKYSIEMMAA